MRLDLCTTWWFVFALACGNVSEDTPDAGTAPDTGDFTLTLVPGSIDISIATSATVTIAVARTGAVGDITLSASGLPAGITATFASNPVPASATSTELTLAVAGGSTASASAVTITGAAGALERSANLAVNAKTVTVAGRLRNGQSGVTVRIVGKDAVTTGPGGTFSFDDVAPPYDIYIVQGSTILFYDDLLRIDPVIGLPASSSSEASNSGTVTGTLSGANLADDKMIVWGDQSGGTSTATNGVYSLSAVWRPATATKAGRLHALTWTEKASGAPDTFKYGSTTATLSSGTSNTVNVAVSPATAAALTGTITAPNGFPAPTVTVVQQLGGNKRALWTATTSTVDANIPVIADGKSHVTASTTMGNASSGVFYPPLDSATDLTFALPLPAVQISPLDGATGVSASAPLEITAPSNAVNLFIIGATSGGIGYFVFSTKQSVSIPAVPELPVPAGQSFRWNVLGLGPASSIDYVVGAKFPIPSTNEVLDTRGFATTTPQRLFTLQ